MRATRRLFPSAALLALVLVRSASAFADGEDVAALLRQGVDLRRDHRNEEALAVFTRAVALSPTPSARAQLALCEQALGRWLDAERDLDLALASKDDTWVTKHADSLDEAREVIRRHLAWLTVDVDVATADVQLDGARLSRGSEARVVSGTGVLEVKAAGYAPDVRRVVLAPAQHVKLAITMTPLSAAPAAAPVVAAPSPAPVEPAPAEAPPPRAKPSLVGPIVLAGVGVVGLGIGSYFGVRTFQQKSDRDAQCVGGCNSAALIYDSDARSSATISTVAMSAGVAFVGAGVVWWLLGRSESPASTTGAIQIAPSIGSTNGLVLRGAL